MHEPKVDNQYINHGRHHWLDYAAVVAASSVALVAWQAAISRDTERRQLRAYVGITPGDIQNFGDRDKQEFTIVRKNHGLTPAYNMIGISLQEVIRIGAPVPLNISTAINQGIPDTVTLFPAMELPVHIRGTPLSQQQLNLALDGREYQLIYYGITWYDDAFGAKHFTRFCYLFKGASMTSKDADGCLGHNNSD